MEVTNRRDAFKAGALRYYTGKMCKNGHTSERLVSSGGCLSCLAGYAKQFRTTQRDRILELQVYQVKAIPSQVATLRRFESLLQACIGGANGNILPLVPSIAQVGLVNTFIESFGEQKAPAPKQQTGRERYEFLCRFYSPGIARTQVRLEGLTIEEEGATGDNGDDPRPDGSEAGAWAYRP